jgi:phosphoribosylformimino-5-aminoimidazole carboxamide ribotide isomerase
VIIGTAALKNPELVRRRRAISPAASSSASMRATAWSRPRAGRMSRRRVIDLARRFEDAGVAALLFTDVGRDGLLKGCNVEATVALARRRASR